jgi:hypothetical protein
LDQASDAEIEDLIIVPAILGLEQIEDCGESANVGLAALRD